MTLTQETKDIILDLAKKSIQNQLLGTNLPAPQYKKYPELKQKAGAFVTLQIEGNLRGCIGYITSHKPLYETIIDAAKQAAFSDPRFPALTKNELDIIDIEISILSPPFPIDSYDDIELGKHGLILEEGMNRGLLLPQVPIEHNMTKEEFLDALCRKASLPKEEWRARNLNMLAFTANVFS